MIIAVNLSYAQDSLCVFNINGSVYAQTAGSLLPISKGMFLNKSTKVMLGESSGITAINDEGSAYQIKTAGEYKYASILRQKALKDSEGLSSKYFKFIWNEMAGKGSKETVIGGVFRGEVLMMSPVDSAKIANSKITFKWQEEIEAEVYYLFIRNVDSDEIIKLATSGTELSIYLDSNIDIENTIEWSVATTEFPNLKNIPFYTISLIDRNEFYHYLKDFEDLISDLKILGLSKNQIEKTICQTYGICK